MKHYLTHSFLRPSGPVFVCSVLVCGFQQSELILCVPESVLYLHKSISPHAPSGIESDLRNECTHMCFEAAGVLMCVRVCARARRLLCPVWIQGPEVGHRPHETVAVLGRRGRRHSAVKPSLVLYSLVAHIFHYLGSSGRFAFFLLKVSLGC